MRTLIIIMFTVLVAGCSNQYANQNITGDTFPSISAQSLEQKNVNIPEDFNDKLTILLIGYKQDTQFDIDRWLIGLDMTKTQASVYEVPTIQGLFPRMFSTVIDNGMRKGIPKPLWKGVITVYKEGEKIQAFTGNENPNNARVLLLNKNGKILYFYDDGFAVAALNELREMITAASN